MRGILFSVQLNTFDENLSRMKKLVSFVFIFFPFLIIAQPLFPIVKADKWGYMNAVGKVVIPFQFDRAGGFYDGRALVIKGDNLGYIDAGGKMVIPAQFAAGGNFNGGLAQAQGRTGGAIHIIDRQGKILARAVAESFTEVSDGLIRQKPFNFMFGLWGYLDNTGKYVIGPQFERAAAFSEGLALVSRDGERYFYINRQGKPISDSIFKVPAILKIGGLENYSAQRFSEGLAAVSDGEKLGYLGKNGKLVIDFVFADAGVFGEGLAPAKKDSLYGFVNRKGEWVIQPRFLLAASFKQGLAAVMLGDNIIDGKWGFINKEGKLVIPATLSGAVGWGEDLHFNNGLCQTYFSPGKWGYINSSGKIIWSN